MSALCEKKNLSWAENDTTKFYKWALKFQIVAQNSCGVFFVIIFF